MLKTNKKTKFIVFLFGLLFLYQIGKWGYGQAAQAYFDYKCENHAGEFIYRTVENVEGLYQMRPRDPRDMISRFRKGDYPEDPYGHSNVESQKPWTMFVSKQVNTYTFLETTKEPDLTGHELNMNHLKFAKKPVFTGEKYWRYELSDEPYDTGEYLIYTSARQVSALESQYGFTWREIRDDWDKFFDVWGGELIVKELSTGEILGLKRGYSFINTFVGKGGACPKRKNDQKMTYYFVSKVLKPVVKKVAIPDNYSMEKPKGSVSIENIN